MAASSREFAIAKVLEHEGGYSNHPDDPGGPTNFGITIADYRRYRKSDATAADVRTMRLDEAKAIYRAAYWDVMHCDSLPAGPDYAVFDYGVNSGVGRAAKVLRRLLGLSGSGGITEAVLVAVGRSDPAELIARLCDERLAFLKGLKTWPVFGAGWGRRVAEVKAAALDMAARAAISAPAGDASTQTHSPRPAQKPAPARTAVRGGVVGLIAATGAAISQWVRPPGASVAMVLAVAVVLAFAGWLVWRRQRRRHD